MAEFSVMAVETQLIKLGGAKRYDNCAGWIDSELQQRGTSSESFESAEECAKWIHQFVD